MYPVTSTVAERFKTVSRQYLSVLVNPVTGDSFELTDADILTNGLNLNRYSASGDSISLGSCVAAELGLRIENGDKRFNSVVFEGASISASIGVSDGNSTSWIPLGQFTIDTAPRRLAVLTISALDGMVQFDKEVNLTALNLPSTVKNLVSAVCNECNVTLDTDLTSFPNASYVVNSIGDSENTTYRTVLQWCCQLMGVCGYMDWNGHLRLAWYSKPSSTPQITPADRYDSDLYENAITITGIVVKNGDNYAIFGSDTYALNIEGNPLVSEGDEQTIADGLAGLVGFSYHPFTASCLPMPYLYPMDMVEFEYDGQTYDCAITEVNVISSGATALRGTGESAQNKSYAKINPLTSRERAIIENLKTEVNATLNKAVNTLNDFNNIISNALGLYHTNVPDGSGGVIRYLHDAPNLEDSTYIVTETAQGFAWTNSGWNSGSPVWSYGVTSGGYALFKWLSAEGIDVTRASSDYRAEVTPEAFNIYYKNELIITIDAEDRGISTPRLTIPYSTTSSNSLRIGNLLFLPAPEGANAVVIEE